MKKTLATLLVVALVASLCGVMFVSAEATNLVAGKTYEISEQYRMGGADVNWGYDPNAPISYPDDNYDLTDGAELVAEYSDACWVGFTKNTPEQTERGYAYINFDLGAASDLEALNYVSYKHKANGIQPAHTIEVYVSNDGENYELAATQNLDDETVEALEDLNYHSFSIDLDVTAQYVQMRITSYGWAFFGEVEIMGTAAATEEPDAPETPAAADVTAKVLDGSLAYSEDALAKLADGNDAAGATAFGDAGLVSFENKGFTHTDGVDAAVPATLELVRDLGSVQAISKITLNAFKDSNSMIALPEVKFYVSIDGVNYYEINSGNLVKAPDDAAETTTAALTADFSTRIAVNARYVKAVATFKNGWLFLSELGVTAATEGNYVENPGVGYAYTEHSVPNPGIGIFDSTDGELDLSLNDGETGKLFRNAQLIKAKYDAETGAYVVIYSKVNPWPDGHTGTETLGEGEILLAISTGGNVGADNNFSGCKWIARGLTEGDYLVLDNGTVSFYPANGQLPGAEDDTPVTGDTGILVFAVLAVVAIAGCAVASKIKSSAL